MSETSGKVGRSREKSRSVIWFRQIGTINLSSNARKFDTHKYTTDSTAAGRNNRLRATKFPHDKICRKKIAAAPRMQ